MLKIFKLHCEKNNICHGQNYFANLGFEALTTVVMQSTIFCDTAPCSPLKVNRGFGGTYRLHLQGRISRARYQRESRWQARRDIHECMEQNADIVKLFLQTIRSQRPTQVELRVACCVSDSYRETVSIYGTTALSSALAALQFLNFIHSV
jgi:hypothetical protein